jgi:hypothetical protein
LVLATWAESYVDGLMKFRHLGSPASPQAIEGLNTWIGRFAAACTRSVEDATNYERRIADLEAEWRVQLGPIRAKSATDELLRLLGGAPILTIDSASTLLGRTFKPSALAIERLVDAGILRQVTVGRRNKAFEAPQVIDAFTALERQLASPEGDTRISEPARRVPRIR